MEQKFELESDSSESEESDEVNVIMILIVSILSCVFGTACSLWFFKTSGQHEVIFFATAIFAVIFIREFGSFFVLHSWNSFVTYSAAVFNG